MGIGTCPVVVNTVMGTRSDDYDEPLTLTYAAPLLMNMSKAGNPEEWYLYGESIQPDDWPNALVVCAENLPPMGMNGSLSIEVSNEPC